MKTEKTDIKADLLETLKSVLSVIERGNIGTDDRYYCDFAGYHVQSIRTALALSGDVG